MRIYLGREIAIGDRLNITLVGIRNPDTTESLTYFFGVMDAGVAEEDLEWERVDRWLDFSYTFLSNPTTYIDLFAIDTLRNDVRALRGHDDYNFYFRIFNA